MASLSKGKNGLARIFYRTRDGERHIVYLGKVPKKTASSVKAWIDRLESAHLHGRKPDSEESRWLADLDAGFHDKLAKYGLVPLREHREDAEKTVGELCDWYIETFGKSKKERTVSIWQQSRRSLVEYFGNKPISEITRGDIRAFHEHLKTSPRSKTDKRALVANTYNKRLSISRQIFEAAVDKRWLEENPFKVLRGLTVRADRSKSRFVTVEETQKLVDAAPDAQWRAIIALCRYCGLRCPSEVLALLWEDVLWEQGKLRVPCPKMERFEDKSERFVPLFDPVREALDELRELAEPGMVHVITRYRSQDQNLRTTFIKIIARAGLEKWPRPLHNLRLSCQTELSAHLPGHVVCSMLGNSPSVAAEHYLRVRDDDFTNALGLFSATHQTTQIASVRASLGENSSEQELVNA